VLHDARHAYMNNIMGQERVQPQKSILHAHTPTEENNCTNKGLPQTIQIESTHVSTTSSLPPKWYSSH